MFDKLSKKIGSKIAFFIVICSATLVALLIFAGVKFLPSGITRIDLSANSMYTLSSETEDLISKINEPITIYLIAPTGEENDGIRTFLERYCFKNKNIKLKLLDPLADADKIFEYCGSTPPANSIVVESSKRYKFIPYYDLFYFDNNAYNYNFQIYATYRESGAISDISFTDFLKKYAVYEGLFTGYEYEESVNSAIRYVISDSLKKVYVVVGHEEDAPSFDVSNLIGNFGIDISWINLDRIEVPQDTDLLLLFPNSDITDTEKNKLSEYMKNGGKLFLVTSYGIDYSGLNYLLNEYGLESDGKYLCEDNELYNYEKIPAYTVPDVTDEGLADILEDQAGTILLAGTTAITLMENVPQGITIKPILTTSPESYTTDDVADYKFDQEKDTRKLRYTGISAFNEAGGGVVWISSPSILYEEYTIYTNGGNLLTLTYFINTLTENTYKDPIPANIPVSASIEVPKWFLYTFATLFCGVIPIGLIGFAVICKVNMRRRNTGEI